MPALLEMTKQQVLKQFQHKSDDSGSVEVQVALLTWRITHLTEHFKAHGHDYHSRVGLQRLVNSRRKLLNYIKREDPVRYAKLLKELELRH